MPSSPPLGATELIEALDLAPHPEGGHFRETWRGPTVAGRSVGTAIYFLLQEGEVSAWHRIDATEIWHFYAGAPLRLSTRPTLSEPAQETLLGPDVGSNQRPQQIVAPGSWQSAVSLGAWTLVGCTVSPGFEFEHFELAPGTEPG